jgi:hypothetical protein
VARKRPAVIVRDDPDDGTVNACAGGGGAIRTTVNRVNDGGPPVRHVQRRHFARQPAIAQGAQPHGQVAEQGLGGGVFTFF